MRECAGANFILSLFSINPMMMMMMIDDVDEYQKGR